MTQNIKNFMGGTKEWFEANYLDGDKIIPGGQMLSSKECFNAIASRQISLIKMIVEDIKKTPIEEGIESSQYKAVEKFKDTISSKLSDLTDGK
jgi:hypothetical protein